LKPKPKIAVSTSFFSPWWFQCGVLVVLVRSCISHKNGNAISRGEAHRREAHTADGEPEPDIGEIGAAELAEPIRSLAL
jgi:hypothetical protein